MKFEIREIEKKDIEAVRKLFEVVSPFVSARSLSDYWLYSRFFSNTCLVASSESNIIGVAIAFINQKKGGEAYLQDLAVVEEARKFGVGMALMDQIIQEVKDSGAENIWLTSEVENSPAMGLWKKIGFTNPIADYEENGYWVSKDLKGTGKDRVVFNLSF